MLKLPTALILSICSLSTMADCNFGNVYEDLDCYEKQLKTSKAELNRTYQKLSQQSDKATQNALEESQKAWLNYRDKQCNGLMAQIGSQAQGGGSGLIITSCLADLTQSRVTELKSLLD